jgi:hypothetical protein
MFEAMIRSWAKSRLSAAAQNVTLEAFAFSYARTNCVGLDVQRAFLMYVGRRSHFSPPASAPPSRASKPPRGPAAPSPSAGSAGAAAAGSDAKPPRSTSGGAAAPGGKSWAWTPGASNPPPSSNSSYGSYDAGSPYESMYEADGSFRYEPAGTATASKQQPPVRDMLTEG